MTTRRILAPHPLLGRFVGITLVLVAALGWLAWRLLQQDRELERQRTRDRLESSADLIAAALIRQLADFGDTLARVAATAPGATSVAAERVAASLPADAVLLVATADRFDSYPRGRVLYDPLPPRGTEPPAAIFARGDSLEFRARNPAAATEVYRALARSRDNSVRAAALLRLGRATRKTNSIRLAAAAYDEMAQLDDALVNGVPASLVARSARITLQGEASGAGPGDGRAEAAELHRALHEGRWRMSRSAFEFYDAEVSRVLGLPPAPHGDSSVAAHMALSDAAAAFWAGWRSTDSEALPSTGVRALRVENQPLIVTWATRGDRLVAIVGGRQFLASILASADPVLERQQVRFTLADANNRPVLASHASALSAARVSRAPTETTLPWTLHVTSAPGVINADTAERQRLLIAGFVVAGLLALFGTYAVSRAASRELRAAQLQSEFVAAVSHEFRTPLTSLRQLTELLAAGRVSTDDRRREYYEAIRRETGRLHRFVESLLDFGRADAGITERRRQQVDASALVRETVREFSREAAAAGYEIELVEPSEPLMLSADSEALERALWNLLDNAVKYSPDARTVNVSVRRQGTNVEISVRDLGIGIPANEVVQIFDKFQRGSVARERGIRGTGIGLALVRQVVESHGGSVTVESVAGAGSTFRIILPIASDA